MLKDVNGRKRTVVGYSKLEDESGECPLEVEYDLMPMDLEFIRSIFEYEDDDYNLINPYDINKNQAKLLQSYVVGGKIDVDRYDFFMEASQASGWDWSKGYPEKLDDIKAIKVLDTDTKVRYEYGFDFDIIPSHERGTIQFHKKKLKFCNVKAHKNDIGNKAYNQVAVQILCYREKKNFPDEMCISPT